MVANIILAKSYEILVKTWPIEKVLMKYLSAYSMKFAQVWMNYTRITSIRAPMNDPIVSGAGRRGVFSALLSRSSSQRKLIEY